MQKKLISFIVGLSVVFFLAVAFDITPFLRGPAEYPEWRWPYQFINTLPKIFPALILIAILLFVFWKLDNLRNERIGKYEKIFLPAVVLLGFLFTLSVIYFSRAGIFVLLFRTINPDANGYFTAALGIKNLGAFLTNFNGTLFPSFVTHARSHPPGADILYYLINQIFVLFPMLNNFVNTLHPSTKLIFEIWKKLSPSQKSGALLISFLMPLISSSISIPLYCLAKISANSKVALRTIFLYSFIPSLILFTPLPDVMFSIFPVIGLWFLILAKKKNNLWFLFLSGLTLALGIFFSLSILAFVLLFLIFIFLQVQKSKQWLKNLSLKVGYLLAGIILPFVILFFAFNFNLLQVSNRIIKITHDTIAQRSYFAWIFYNLYDFFVFAGIPMLVLFAVALKNNFKKILKNYLLVSFIATLLILDFSGNVKGEAARLWIPFVPFLVLIASQFISKDYKFTTKNLLIILLVQAIQVLVIQEFWVPLW